MKDMLSKIYNSEYFVIGLFVIIVILAIVFLLLVFSGKKKKEKGEVNVNKEENNNLEQNLEVINNVATASTESSVPTPTVEPKIEPASTQPSAPIDIAPTAVATPEPVSPVAEPVAPVTSEPSFNTSIFHGMPESIASAMQEPTPVAPAQEVKEDVSSVAIGQTDNQVNNNVENTFTSNLFEPAPDLSQVSLNVDSNLSASQMQEPVSNAAPTVNDIMPNFDTSAPVEKPVAPVVEEPKLGDYQKERIQMPNQFSSVYINKEEPKVEPVKPAVETPKSDKPPYDPSLFNTIYDPVPEIKPVMPEENNIASTPVSTPASETPSIPDMPTPEIKTPEVEPQVKEEVTPAPFELPKFDTLPPLEPITPISDDTDLDKTATDIQINPQNTFEMPSLASNDTTSTESGLPNFNNETFNINK